MCGLLQVSLFVIAPESRLIHFLDSRDLLPSSIGRPPLSGTEAIPVTTSGQGDGAHQGPNANLEVWGRNGHHAPTQHPRGPSLRTR